MQTDIDSKVCNFHQCNNDEETVLNNDKIFVYQIPNNFGDCGIPVDNLKFIFNFWSINKILGLHT